MSLLAQRPAGAQQPGGGVATEGQQRPNVLLVMTDDQGWGDVYSHGNDRLSTPAMDQLAVQGARFNRFYVSSVCAPTRASLLTGRYYLRTGVADVTRGLEAMRASEVTVAEALQDAGYATGLFGKWHLGGHYPNVPRAQGFDTFFGFLAGHWNNYFDPALLQSQGNAPPDTVQTDGYISDVLTDRAIRFMESHRDAPFFGYVSYNAPHAPYQVPDRYFEKYKARGVGDKTAAVYGMVDNLDDNLERLLQAVDRLGLREETVVIFLTDNGPNGDRYNGGMRGNKGSMHEGGVRVPFFIRWPGHIPEGQTIRERTAHIDVLPTLAELAGVEIPATAEPLDGRSFAPLILSRSPSDNSSSAVWSERTLFEHRGMARNGLDPYPGAVRTERYRLVCEEEPCALYDMIRDPSQSENIASEEPAVAERLYEAYHAWLEDVTERRIERPPVPVGYEEAPTAELPTPEAYFTSGLSYAYRGYAHEWLTGWASAADSVWWEMDVTRPGRYAVDVMYTAPEGQPAVTMRAEVAGQTTAGTLTPTGGHEPAVRRERDPDAHRPVKDFTRKRLGTLRLSQGAQRLVLALKESLPKGSVDVQSVRLRRLE